ncbi:Mu-like prophage major head subunit gpT family protein [Leisingera sp. HS039]|uniref:prohead protease/major capsid protein fusion protein n=1 Tax=Leisingera sp. HS039 TaxID=2818496 RepID=UPI001B3A0FD1|nr:prohead protease/major capsid protein fusion protein [Leisingera sp. HS039]MBQ4824152.1 Mu-like prophage major head subunit gpT family protein [Leisingera sp. HS039]
MPLDLQTRSEHRAPATLDREARTVEAVLSTGADVARFGLDGEYIERLSLDASALDLTRAEGAPVLDSHRQDALDRILGRLQHVRIEKGALIGTIKISSRHSAILDDIEDGIIRGVSIGYTIERYREEADPETGQRVRVATKWALVEASLVAVPADAASTIRSGRMPDSTTGAEQPHSQETGNSNAVLTRANVNAEIRSIAQTFELPQSFVDNLIDRGATADQARAAALQELQQRQTGTVQTRISNVRPVENQQELVSSIGEAMYARSNPAHQLGERAREFYGMTTLDVARDCLTRAGQTVTGASASALITRALQSTSDYPLIFADTVNRSLMASYQAAPATLKMAAKRSTARDFRRKTKIQLGEGPTLEKVNEAGEFKSGAMAEAKESYAIDTFGRIVGFTRQALINDDIGALTDPASKLGMAANEFEAQFLVDLLEGNSGAGPDMDDGNPLFHADHGNVATAGVLNEGNLSLARLAMRKQKGLSGQRINVTPKFLVVPPELETSAEKLLASIQPSKADDVNPFSQKLQLLVEARLSSAQRWYVVADPATIEGLEYSYLQGEEGPQIETRAGFEVDGMEFKIRLDFGAAFLDWRSWLVNDGA